jgi:hypothetical protein
MSLRCAIHAFLFAPLFSVCGASLALNAASQVKQTQPTPQANTQPAPKPTGKPIARVLQNTIYSGQVEPTDEQKKAAQKQLKGDMYKKWMDGRFSNLASAVMNQLVEQYANDRKISVAGNEVDSFFDYSERARKMQAQQLQQAITQLNAQIQSGKLQQSDKDRATAMKQEFEKRLGAVSKTLPKATQQEREMAQRIIRNWKCEQQLYNQYGGQVISTPSSPFQPIGAYKAFLQEREKQKAFEITDSEYKKRFWAVFTPSKDTPVVPKEQVDFSKPWWVLIVEKAQVPVK